MINSNQNYQATLRDLEFRRNHCQEELRAVEQAIAGIRALLARDASLLVQIPQNERETSSANRYAGMSVRWGVLQYLAKDAREPASTAEIAAALRKGGMTTSGRDFLSNVSAVISVMVNKRQELEAVGDGTYRLTETGHNAWNAITGTNQYQSRSLNFSANVQ